MSGEIQKIDLKLKKVKRSKVNTEKLEDKKEGFLTQIDKIRDKYYEDLT